MKKFQAIEAKINALKEHAAENQMDALNRLHSDFLSLSNADNGAGFISSVLKEENDCAEAFDIDSGAFSEVREIQDAIIGLLRND